jgi:nitrous oxidase accessory protein NosD
MCRKILTTGGCAVLITVAVAIAAAPAAFGQSPLIVGNGTSPASCQSTAGYSTISSAVSAASSGDTIEVCPGTYLETVNVSTADLTFEGAQYGMDPVTKSPKASKQSVVISDDGGFILSSSADDTVIDGFTIEYAGTDGGTNQDGVEAFQGSSGLTLEDNIIRDNNEGINFQNPDGSDPAYIEDNIFSNNSDGGNYESNPQTGTAVFISNGPADNTLITANSFSGDSQTAINFAGDASSFSTGLTVSHNKSNNDSTFVVATNSTGALIEHNSITSGPNAPGGLGDAILDFGSNAGLQIVDNVISASGGTSSAYMQSGVHVSDYSGTPSTNTTIASNTITGYYNGVLLDSDAASVDVLSNKITNSVGVGINAVASSTGNLINKNTISGSPSPALDCQDASTGTGSDGTANTWTSNNGENNDSSPSGICP